MTLFSTLALAMGASWVSGINLYAGVATLGLLGRYAGLELPGELTVLTDWWVIGVALGMYVVEFVADKIPYVDSTWDVVHTFIRVPAGAVLAAATFGAFDGSVQVIAFLLGGGIALSSHGMKTGTRAAINTSPEPVSNITASVAEDAVAVGSIGLAAFFPIAIVVLVSLAVLASLFIIPRTLGSFRNFLRRFRSSPD
ncbi:MAG: DUF4126 domain-containing protein [Bacteroidota bacterium]|jgi:hypothetical protein|nr:DUF4126 domain-containing protein [Bacteroidota bacterium]